MRAKLKTEISSLDAATSTSLTDCLKANNEVSGGGTELHSNARKTQAREMVRNEISTLARKWSIVGVKVKFKNFAKQSQRIWRLYWIQIRAKCKSGSQNCWKLLQ